MLHQSCHKVALIPSQSIIYIKLQLQLNKIYTIHYDSMHVNKCEI